MSHLFSGFNVLQQAARKMLISGYTIQLHCGTVIFGNDMGLRK